MSPASSPGDGFPDLSPLRREQHVKAKMREVYRRVNDAIGASELGRYATFLNYGYAAEPGDISAQRLPRRVMNHFSTALVHEVVGLETLDGAHVLEVGCGRGGNARILVRNFGVTKVTGLDLSPEAIIFCRGQANSSKLAFMVGDAEDLPFADETFEGVLNIESSHSYPDLFGFYGEAVRVLKPQGLFLYADVLPRAVADAGREELERLGLSVEADRDITANVLKSRQLQTQESQDLLGEAIDPQAREFLGLPGSSTYRALEDGTLVYRLLRCRKTRARALGERQSPTNALVAQIIDSG